MESLHRAKIFPEQHRTRAAIHMIFNKLMLLRNGIRAMVLNRYVKCNEMRNKDTNFLSTNATF